MRHRLRIVARGLQLHLSLLTDQAGLAASGVPLVLVGYGIGAMVGTNLGGMLGTRHAHPVLFIAAAATFVVLVALYLFSGNPVITVALIVLLGLFGMATNPILIGMAVRYADRAPTLASALSTSSFNLGTAVGSWIAGHALETTLGPTGPVLVGAAVAALYFVPLVVLLLKERAAGGTTQAPATRQEVSARETVTTPS